MPNKACTCAPGYWRYSFKRQWSQASCREKYPPAGGILNIVGENFGGSGLKEGFTSVQPRRPLGSTEFLAAFFLQHRMRYPVHGEWNRSRLSMIVTVDGRSSAASVLVSFEEPEISRVYGNKELTEERLEPGGIMYIAGRNFLDCLAHRSASPLAVVCHARKRRGGAQKTRWEGAPPLLHSPSSVWQRYIYIRVSVGPGCDWARELHGTHRRVSHQTPSRRRGSSLSLEVTLDLLCSTTW